MTFSQEALSKVQEFIKSQLADRNIYVDVEVSNKKIILEVVSPKFFVEPRVARHLEIVTYNCFASHTTGGPHIIEMVVGTKTTFFDGKESVNKLFAFNFCLLEGEASCFNEI